MKGKCDGCKSDPRVAAIVSRRRGMPGAMRRDLAGAVLPIVDEYRRQWLSRYHVASALHDVCRGVVEATWHDRDTAGDESATVNAPTRAQGGAEGRGGAATFEAGRV